MAKLVKVWNKNILDYEENFKGNVIKIPANEYITMERAEAVEFKGKFRQPVYNKGGVQEIHSMKKIVLEPIEAKTVEIEEPLVTAKHTCMKCGFEAKNSTGLSAHIRASHLADMVDDDARKELIAKGI
jgi:hypothetical protein